MWTIILNFSSKVEVHRNLTKEEARKMVKTVVFTNEDCVNIYCFKQ